jgi:hypothetical protein
VIDAYAWEAPVAVLRVRCRLSLHETAPIVFGKQRPLARSARTPATMDKEPGSNLRPRRDLHLDLAASTPNATIRSRARSFSQALPSLRVSTSPTSLSPPPLSPLGAVPGTINKARAESRKLLAHLLSRLKARPQAPSVYDNIRADSTRKDPRTLGAVVDTVRSAVRFKGARDFSEHNVADRNGEEDVIVDNDQDYSTDVTYNHMVQLRDVLILCDRQGWQIFQAMSVLPNLFLI